MTKSFTDGMSLFLTNNESVVLTNDAVNDKRMNIAFNLTLLLPFSPKGENYNPHFKSIFVSSDPCPSVRIKGTLFTPKSRPLQGKKFHCLATNNPVSKAILVYL